MAILAVNNQVLATLVQEYEDLRTAERMYEAAKKELNAKVMALLGDTEPRHVTLPDGLTRLVQIKQSSQQRLDKELLLKNGVAPEIIKASTVTTSRAPFVLIKTVKGKDIWDAENPPDASAVPL